MKTSTLTMLCYCMCWVGVLDAQIRNGTFEFQPELSFSQIQLNWQDVDTAKQEADHSSLNLRLQYGLMVSSRLWIEAQLQLRPEKDLPESFDDFSKRFNFEGRYYFLQSPERYAFFAGSGLGFELDAPDGRILQQLFFTLGSDWKVQPGLWLSPRLRYGMQPDQPDIQRLGLLLNLRFLQQRRKRATQKPDIRFHQGRFYIHNSRFALLWRTGENGPASYDLHASSRFGYFLASFLVAGAELSLLSNRRSEEPISTVGWKIGQFFRFYLNPLSGHSKFFVEAAWNRRRTSLQKRGSPSYDYWFQYGGGAGLNLFLDHHLAIEFRLDYRTGNLTQLRGVQRELRELDSQRFEFTLGMQYFLK